MKEVMCHDINCFHNKGLMCRCQIIELPFPWSKKFKHSCFKFLDKKTSLHGKSATVNRKPDGIRYGLKAAGEPEPVIPDSRELAQQRPENKLCFDCQKITDGTCYPHSKTCVFFEEISHPENGEEKQ
jgi:hypothetical protein